MKKIIIFTATALLLISCGSGEEATGDAIDTVTTEIENVEETINEIVEEVSSQIAQDIDAASFKQKMEENPGQIIDVRTASEYAGGNITNSQNIDFYGDDFSALLDELDKDIPVYIYCRSGGRSGNAKNMLVEKGFSVVYNLNGGFSNWPY